MDTPPRAPALDRPSTAPRTLGELAKLLAAIVACEAAGAIGALATGAAIDTWYRQIRKPSFTPPDWVFAPVWTVLYALMGVSLYLIWRAGARGRATGPALTLFAIQLVLNALWSFLFFRFRAPGVACVEIVVLWAAIALTMVAAFRLSRWAGLLLVPYLLWVGFAALLNGAIWRLNAG
jgi:tryptophan-rich sensory protein